MGDGHEGKSRCSVPFPVALRPATPPAFHPPVSAAFLRVPLSLAVSFDGVGRARGVTNPSRIRIAAADSRHSPCHWPRRHSETQWKAQIRCRLPVGETNSWKLPIAQDCYPPGFGPAHPGRFISTPSSGHRRSLSLSLSPFHPFSLSALSLFRRTCSQSHPNAGNSTIGRASSPLVPPLVHARFPSSTRKGKRSSTNLREEERGRARIFICTPLPFTSGLARMRFQRSSLSSTSAIQVRRRKEERLARENQRPERVKQMINHRL